MKTTTRFSIGDCSLRKLHVNGCKARNQKDGLEEKHQGIVTSRLSSVRHSIAYYVSSNYFEIYVTKMGVKPLSIQPHNADEVVKACCVLHNFLRCEKGSVYRSDSPQTSPALQPISRVGRHPSTQALAVRSGFTNYFSSPEGEIPWQIEHVNRVR